MKKHGKKYRAAAEKIDLARKYTLDEAVKTLKEIAFAKFDETVELTIWLGVDPRKADQLVRGTLGLAARLGQIKNGSGDRAGRQDQRSRRGRRRFRRRRRHGHQNQRRLARL